MATGTFVTAKLMRSDQSTPWGFRLQGGQEFSMPLSMAKVSTMLCLMICLEFGKRSSLLNISNEFLFISFRFFCRKI